VFIHAHKKGDQMTNTRTCPRCGTENRSDATNCAASRINLKFAQEHPAEIERMKQEDALRGQQANSPAEGTGASTASGGSLLLPGLLLFGAFVFVFCLGEAVHELGHFLAHRAYGTEVGFRLDPFGDSRILNGSSAPQETLGLTSLAGPMFNLLVGLAVSLSLWRLRRPALLPLLLWGPISLVQEGVTFSLGMLTPGGDADLMVRWGIPAALLIGLGILFFALGIAMICWLLPLVNLSPTDSFGRKFGVVMGSMVSFMFLRLLFSSLRSSNLIVENTVPLVFALLLATLVAALYAPLYPLLSRISRVELASTTWPAAVTSLALGFGMVILQLAVLN
jgi:hypothetical protein